ncbi:MAG TPA: hypothetical protein VER98_00980 [Terriglobia bacterium]|nr:hypothetical protein [Terriglobia bacterium]
MEQKILTVQRILQMPQTGAQRERDSAKHKWWSIAVIERVNELIKRALSPPCQGGVAAPSKK